MWCLFQAKTIHRIEIEIGAQVTICHSGCKKKARFSSLSPAFVVKTDGTEGIIIVTTFAWNSRRYTLAQFPSNR